jgi:hypothetical protein
MLSGNGIVQAKGGAADGGYSAPGGGGRIAIGGFTVNQFIGTLGRAGTIFIQAQNEEGGQLLLDNTSLTIAAGQTNRYAAIQSTTNGVSIITNLGALELTSDALVVGANLTFYQDGVVKGAQRGSNWIGAVTIQNGGLVTHLRGDINGVQLNVDGPLVVEAGGKIDVSTNGYLGGWTAALTNYPGGVISGYGQIPGPGGIPTQNGGAYRAGASHGSLGVGNYPNALYGSEKAPVLLGSGGGSEWNGYGGEGGRGGGRLYLQAASFQIDGQLLADGEGNYRSGGSGGSIFLVARGGAFAGAGLIRAKGGQAGSDGWHGGGGRIAIVGYSADHFTGTLRQAGTIFRQAQGLAGDLILDKTSLTIGLGQSNVFNSIQSTTNGVSIITNLGTLALGTDALIVGTNLVLFQDGVVKGANRESNWIGSVTIQNGGLVTHLRGNPNGVQFHIAGPLQVDAGGKIDVSTSK